LQAFTGYLQQDAIKFSQKEAFSFAAEFMMENKSTGIKGGKNITLIDINMLEEAILQSDISSKDLACLKQGRNHDGYHLIDKVQDALMDYALRSGSNPYSCFKMLNRDGSNFLDG
jgi:hypothetical protein